MSDTVTWCKLSLEAADGHIRAGVSCCLKRPHATVSLRLRFCLLKRSWKNNATAFRKTLLRKYEATNSSLTCQFLADHVVGGSLQWGEWRNATLIANNSFSVFKTVTPKSLESAMTFGRLEGQRRRGRQRHRRIGAVTGDIGRTLAELRATPSTTNGTGGGRSKRWLKGEIA